MGSFVKPFNTLNEIMSFFHRQTGIDEINDTHNLKGKDQCLKPAAPMASEVTGATGNVRIALIERDHHLFNITEEVPNPAV
jgi:hypothetical protein